VLHQQVAGTKPYPRAVECILGQIVHIHVKVDLTSHRPCIADTYGFNGLGQRDENLVYVPFAPDPSLRIKMHLHVKKIN